MRVSSPQTRTQAIDLQQTELMLAEILGIWHVHSEISRHPLEVIAGFSP